MTVQEAEQCDACTHGAREAHRQAVTEFIAIRDQLAAGHGLPAAVAYSPGASRQWVSDELTQSARAMADRSRAAGEAWLQQVRRRSLLTVWASVVALTLGQTVTAIGAGWTGARTAGLLAALTVGALLSCAAHLHRSRGGLLAPVTGEDNRISTSRAVAAAWVLFLAFALLVMALQLAWASSAARRDTLIEGLGLARGGGMLFVLALVCAIAVAVRRVVAVRLLTRRLQKLRADRPRLADLLCDDSGRGSFADTQYVLVSAAAVTFALVRLARRPERLPDLPWGLALLVAVSAATYFAAKYAEGGRPLVLSVVRAREPGELDAPIRTGDNIEIRGVGFVPPGAGEPDRLTRMIVRIGAVHVQVPLIPVPGGFANPTDTMLTVPVPVEVEPGQVDIQVVTAAGMESNRCLIEVTEWPSG